MDNKSNTLFAAIAGTCSAGLVLLGMVTCCGMPLLAGILATVGVGASQLSFLAKYQGLFMGIAIISLIFGFYQAYFVKKSSCCGAETPKPQGCCATQSCCAVETADSDLPAKPSSFLQFQKVFLWIGVAVVVIALLVSGNNASITDTNGDKTGSCCPAASDDEIGSCCPANVELKNEKQSNSANDGDYHQSE